MLGALMEEEGSGDVGAADAAGGAQVEVRVEGEVEGESWGRSRAAQVLRQSRCSMGPRGWCS